MTEAVSSGRRAATPKRPGRPRSVEATAAVLDAAYRLSAAHGLRGATIQAIADASGVSKMTIYKWWENRLQLLIDAFLRHASQALPLDEDGTAVEIISAHAARYVVALQGDLGSVQLAVLAECLAETGSSQLFVDRYLSIRRELGLAVIQRGQAHGEISSTRSAADLYDQIYGTLFYRSQFGLGGLDQRFVRALVEATLGP